ncbi:hypothetical protein DY023_08740 [Microbacterium bovistercoris]|uniref:Uncharacterized protein n=1 Tax=Microbacterium bovistercoris TaxID=2293570 RepID=A0A371NTK5_9MICO|nr:hypothetical protein [Microbacterium bovistercoris]REJ05673.1 hypothetical protein DY023_08740 [Microbacterium bovistercoris]
MFEHPYFTQTIFAIENEQLNRAAERRRAIQERLEAQPAEKGTTRRTRAARSARRTVRGAASAARDVTPCANCPAAA